MSVFATPEPVSVRLELPFGDATIVAGDRPDTVVEVRPRNSSRKDDVRAADQATVELTDRTLQVIVPEPPGRGFGFGSGGAVEVEIGLPAGSDLRVRSGWGTLRADGRLGECRITTGGDVRIAEAGDVEIEDSSGDIVVEQAQAVRITTGSGEVRLRRVDGPAVVKNSAGDIWVGEVTGDTRLSTGSGGIVVEVAHSDVSARTSAGTIRVTEVARGTVDLQTAYGDIDVGVRSGTAAWLDVDSPNGGVHNVLDLTGPPEKGEETVEVRARSGYGDIRIRRA
ncbi:DUF4097 family beta strand repeat-containing protein [Pseudonocardia sp. TRM90224]|uniref:DUF4097 family beta strand repeat-containing protein n=1 Tax=Pseudonocardia sp. TRM90224 TaxID=2812678 RepID=UPI001E35E2D5|nr:DUF4097 family beta strand repeat-containing protein [Pseudonocardia sp. TRM90224]